MKRSGVLHLGLFLSGAAGLIYESSWTRLLQRVFGVSDLAVATVLACFFLGLGLGAALAGRFAKRTTKPARLYAFLEIGVGLYALASLFIVPEVGAIYGLVGADASFTTLTAVRVAAAALVLLPPTVLMGATLPVLAETDGGAGWSRTLTGLYTTNTFGAMFGAGLAGLYIVPQLGTRAAVIVGALGSFAAAAIVFAAMRELDVSKASDEVEEAEPAPTPSGERAPIILAGALTFITGFAALAGEVLWTRALRIIVHGTTVAFAAMLVNYLFGIAVGAVAARWLVKRFDARRVFGVVQLAMVPAIALAMWGVSQVPRIIPLLRHEADIVPHEPSVMFAVGSMILLPIALLVGTGLPLTWAMIDRAENAAEGSGRLMAANTIGGLLGSLFTGFVFVPFLGMEASLLLLTFVHAIASALAFRAAAPEGLQLRIASAVGPVVVAVGVFLVGPPRLDLPFLLRANSDPMSAMLRGPGPGWTQDIAFLREGRNTTVTAIRTGQGLSLFNDGRPESGFSNGPVGFGRELVMLGGFPGLVGERDRALIVGLGAGHTATMALETGFQHVEIVELEDAVVDAARLLYRARQRPFPVDDPRAELRVDDARNRLAILPAESLDAVIQQPSHPWLAGSSALYTDEFFGTVHRVLRPRGVFALWLNLFRLDLTSARSVVRTLTETFPYVYTFVVEDTSLIFFATKEPLEFTDEIERRMQAAEATVPYFTFGGFGTLPEFMARLELDPEATRAFGEGGDLIRDDRPLLEFHLAAIANNRGVSPREFDAAVEGSPWPGASMLGHVARLDEAVRARAIRVAPRRRALSRIAPDGAVAGLEASLRGDVTRALAALDADEAGAADASRLRFAEGMYEATVRRAIDGPLGDREAVIEAAAALGRRDLVLALRDRHRIVDAPEGAALIAWAEGDCDRAADLHSTATRAATSEMPGGSLHVAARLARCVTDDARSVALDAEHDRVRSAWLAEINGRAERALGGGNGGLAWMLFRRALVLWPSSARAAAGLARLHHRDGRDDDARAVLVRAWASTDGLHEARQRLAATATELGVDLGNGTADAASPDTSASTAPTAEMTTSHAE